MLRTLDFQWFIPASRVDQAYGFELRMDYVPFKSPEQIQKLHEREVRRWAGGR